jgi:hypothetical protein
MKIKNINNDQEIKQNQKQKKKTEKKKIFKKNEGGKILSEI